MEREIIRFEPFDSNFEGIVTSTSKGGLTARNRSAKVLESLDPALTESE
jgi:hypothetical protein